MELQLEPEADSEPDGGSGATCTDTARDSRMLERAVRERWPIPDAARRLVPKRLIGIIEDPRTSRRSKISAIKTLAMLDRLNQADTPKQHQHKHTIELTPAERQAHVEAVIQEAAGMLIDVQASDPGQIAGQAPDDERRGVDSHQPARPSVNGNGHA